MKGFTTRWIPAVAAAAILMLPASGVAQTPPATQPPATQPPATQPPATQPPATQPPATQPPAQDPATQTARPDEQAARRHLTEARNTLSALTQLPAASQLSGEARTQVAQLISNFNELITTQAEWRASYDKVSANLTSLIGPDTNVTDPASATGTAGAVGTSGMGMADLDPTIRTKLVDLRRTMNEFEKAASGGAGAASPSMTQPDMTSTPPAGSSTPPSTTAPPSTTSPATTQPDAATNPAQGAQAVAGNAEVMRHVAAIEALLKLENESGGLTLTQAQVEQLRTHWAALRQALDKR